MPAPSDTELIDCPCCGASESTHWLSENGFDAVRCSECGLIYVNPRPVAELISEAVKTGVHSNVEHGRTAIERRVGSKVDTYRKLLGELLKDVWTTGRDVSWLDVGAGYGEVVEAVGSLATPGSRIEGIEPMQPKADAARQRGLAVREAHLSDLDETYDFVSLINVFSHIPDFREFLGDLRNVLRRGGELVMETGDVGSLSSAADFGGEWDLPDHLVFADPVTLERFLTEAGFEVVAVERRRVDGVVRSAKSAVKRALGRPGAVRLPYTSPYRSMLVRAVFDPQRSAAS